MVLAGAGGGARGAREGDARSARRGATRELLVKARGHSRRAAASRRGAVRVPPSPPTGAWSSRSRRVAAPARRRCRLCYDARRFWPPRRDRGAPLRHAEHAERVRPARCCDERPGWIRKVNRELEAVGRAGPRPVRRARPLRLRDHPRGARQRDRLVHLHRDGRARLGADDDHARDSARHLHQSPGATEQASRSGRRAAAAEGPRTPPREVHRLPPVRAGLLVHADRARTSRPSR